MDKNVEILMLTGKEALVVPCLAIVGAATIMGGLGYGAYKFGKKVCEKLNEKEVDKEFQEESV